MRVVIAGAGVAGLACALALRQLGFDCRLHERAAGPGCGGMGFLLTPKVSGLLQQLGVAADALARVPLRGFTLQELGGRGPVTAALPAGFAGASRAALMQGLLAAWGDEARVLRGRAVLHYEFDRSGQRGFALLQDHTELYADLFIGADGARSRARQHLFPGTGLVAARVHEFVGLAQAPGLGRELGGCFGKLHHRPRGLAFGQLPVGEDQAVWFVQFDAERHAAWTRPGAPPPGDLLQQALGHWPAPVPALLAATAPACIHHWQPQDAEVPPALARGRLVLAGDAAAPLLPFTSQGVTAALADALALRDVLRHVRDAAGLAPALARYDALRRPPRQRLVAEGRRMAQEFLLPRPPATAPCMPVALDEACEPA